jgi:hypothetical protein
MAACGGFSTRIPGSPSPGVYEAFEDSDGVLWLGQGASLSRVELNTPITEVARHFGSTLVRFQGGLYLGSSAGGGRTASSGTGGEYRGCPLVR